MCQEQDVKVVVHARGEAELGRVLPFQEVLQVTVEGPRAVPVRVTTEGGGCEHAVTHRSRKTEGRAHARTW